MIKRTQIVLIDDSKIVLELLSNIIEKAPDLEIVGKFQDGFEALKKLPDLKPDLICMDFYMPKINGLELTKKIMETNPIRILIVSSVLDVRSSKEVFPFLEAGALDCVEKPKKAEDTLDEPGRQFIDKIRVLSKAPIWRKQFAASFKKPPPVKLAIGAIYNVIVIGSSTGGPVVLMNILKMLPQNFPIPIICIQHISKGFLGGLVEFLAQNTKLQVKIMIEHEPLKTGYVYLPQEGCHLAVDDAKLLTVPHQPPINGQRPSIDLTMQSFANRFGIHTIGIILSGMGSDGAQGMSTIRSIGGLTIAQSPETCVVASMPKEAISQGNVSIVLNVDEIAPYLLKVAGLARV